MWLFGKDEERYGSCPLFGSRGISLVIDARLSLLPCLADMSGPAERLLISLLGSWNRLGETGVEWQRISAALLGLVGALLVGGASAFVVMGGAGVFIVVVAGAGVFVVVGGAGVFVVVGRAGVFIIVVGGAGVVVGGAGVSMVVVVVVVVFITATCPSFIMGNILLKRGRVGLEPSGTLGPSHFPSLTPLTTSSACSLGCATPPRGDSRLKFGNPSCLVLLGFSWRVVSDVC